MKEDILEARVKILEVIRRFKDRIETKASKVDVLALQWNLILKDLNKRLKKDKDPELKSFIERVEKVDEAVKLDLFKHYVNRAGLKYRVAFCQWRTRNPKARYDMCSGIVEKSHDAFFKEHPISRRAL